MFSDRQRIVQPELLDHQTPADAAPSLRDLVRINSMLGGHRTTRLALAEVARPEEHVRVLDVGAASGDMGRVTRAALPNASVTSLDYRIDHLARAAPPRVVADAFRLPFPARSFDIVSSSLFLHHFSDSQIVDLLAAFHHVARRAVIINDLERHLFAWCFLPATRWLFGWNRITLHDGPVSVQAAFKAEELTALARRAGLTNTEVRVHRPAFRLALIARV